VFEGFESKSGALGSLASAYDVWFEREGKSIFASELEALRQILPLLAKPWIEIGVGKVVLRLVLRESPWAQL